jgi:hypothetical protein
LRYLSGVRRQDYGDYEAGAQELMQLWRDIDDNGAALLYDQLLDVAAER